jgi:hypothetical protein
MNPYRKLLNRHCEARAEQCRYRRQDPLRGPWQSSDFRSEEGQSHWIAAVAKAPSQ